MEGLSFSGESEMIYELRILNQKAPQENTVFVYNTGERIIKRLEFSLKTIGLNSPRAKAMDMVCKAIEGGASELTFGNYDIRLTAD